MAFGLVCFELMMLPLGLIAEEIISRPLKFPVIIQGYLFGIYQVQGVTVELYGDWLELFSGPLDYHVCFKLLLE